MWPWSSSKIRTYMARINCNDLANHLKSPKFVQSDIESLFHRTDSAEEAVRGAHNYGGVAFTTYRVLQVVCAVLRETSVAIYQQHNSEDTSHLAS